MKLISRDGRAAHARTTATLNGRALSRIGPAPAHRIASYKSPSHPLSLL
jgi:hypothetical protein